MTSDEITVVVAVDEAHLSEWKLSFPTWIKYKKEFREFKYLVMYDADQLKDTDCRFDEIKKYDVEFFPWRDCNKRYSTQREKMLTSLVFSPQEVKTRWFLKIDTDTIAMDDSSWINEAWFDNNVFISNPWGYTKPPNAIVDLDLWANQISYFKNTEPLKLIPKDGANCVPHSRIISWLFFGNTEWGKEIASLVEDEKKLPIPSQDTFSFYCAERMKKKYLKIKFKKFGWDHIRMRL